METLLSVDLGTTGCKAAVYSVEGQVLGTSYIEYPLIGLSPEFVEQDANLWWSLTQQVIQEAIAKSGVKGRGIRALSVSSQGISFVPINRSGQVLRNAINWLDTRATTQAAAIRRRIKDEHLFQVTGKRPGAFYVLPKLLWLREHEPGLFGETYKFLMAHDYLLYKLCGATVTDFSMAGGSLLLDLHLLNWSDELLTTFEIGRDQLPDLAWAGSTAGELASATAEAIGLSPGTPVVVGGQDQKCAALGAAIRPGVATVSLGTASAISCLIDEPALDAERRIPTFPFVVPGYWDFEGVVSTAGAALTWVRDTVFPNKDHSALDELANQSPPGANGVRFYPHLTGATSPLWQVGARGAFTGLSLATSSADLVRSVLEGIAFQIRANLDVIQSMAPVEELVLFGGGAKSDLWCDIISQVTDKPVFVTEMVDVANWGACVLAGLGAGVYEDYTAAELSTDLTLRSAPLLQVVNDYDAIFQEYIEAEGQLVGEG
jgi:xylulokinase